MQNGGLSREQRKRSSDVWCYRWWESGPTGRRIHRRIILGTVEQLHDKRAANQATVGLRREINSHDIRTKTTLMTVAELADHFRQRELLDSNMRITLLHQKSVCRLLDEMDCAALGTECTAAHQGQRSGVVAVECATRTNHARENPQCDECAIQPCTPVRSLGWQPLSNGCAKAPNAVVLPMYLRLKRYGIYWQRYRREKESWCSWT